MTPTAAGRLIMRIRPAFLAAALKRLLRVRRLEADTPEGRFWADPASYLGLTLLEAGRYEPEMLRTLDRYLAPGSIFVDVGANEGYFAVAAARRVGPGGRVAAIEPQARLEPVLRRNFALNGCAWIQLSSKAVSDRTGEVALHLTPGVNNSASSLLRPTRYPLARQQAACAPLEDIMRELGFSRASLMKIDIEGWEHEAVLGSPRLFREGLVRALALELHPSVLARRGLSAETITGFLESCGYRRDPEASSLVYTRD